MALTPVSLPQLSISLPRPSLLPRRMLLSMGAVPILYNVNLAFGAPIPQKEEPEILQKLPGGVRVQGIVVIGHHALLQDIVDGEGPTAKEGDVVTFNYVCRRSNGYFVYSTVDQFTGEAMPVTLSLDEKQIIKGLKDVLTGMKVGGKRRALIPPSTGYVNESLKPIPEEFGPRRSLLSHANEPLIFEVILEIDHEQIQEEPEDSAKATPCDASPTYKLEAEDAIGLILDYAGFWIYSCSSVLTELVTSSDETTPFLNLCGRNTEESNQSSSGYAEHYIVYLGSHHAEPRLSASHETIKKSHHELISSVLRSDSESSSERIIYSYNKIYNGFAATLHEEEANELAKHPSVVSIFESRILELATTRSADFLGLHYPPSNHEDSIWHKANFGEDIILANIDSGVWPEIQSFSDDESYGPIPKKFKGACENKHDPTFKCNRKLIGARYFYKAMEKLSNSQINCTFSEKLSPRDDKNGHGTHTLSTAGGNIVPFASWGGLANGTAKGMAPKARLVSYKTLWDVQCPTFKTTGSNEIDMMAAFEAAIDDGVDIINFSQGISSNSAYLDDGTGIATFHAMKNGILTIAGVGNDGPNTGTVTNNYPWVLSVGASTTDRVFSAHVLLGNHQKINGTRFYDVAKANDPSKLYPLITGADAHISGANVSNASSCQKGTLDVAKVTGKILVCRNAGIMVKSDETMASVVAKDAGAVGMIFVYEEKIGDGAIFNQIHGVNTIVVSYKDGETLFSYINSTRTPTASISGVTNTLGVKPSPIMGIFSSRGPNQNNPGILKPDVTAPGVDILAACPPNIFQNSYCILSGTSMSTPHVTGIAALIKKLHPDWSTAAIKSAIMTTASPLDNDGMSIRDSDKINDATPFAYGSGHVKPNAAMDPGLVYDMNQYDYLNFLCAYFHDSKTLEEFSQQHSYKCPRSFNILDFNYPSISIVNFTGNAIVTRKLKNVGQPGTYVPRIEPPPGVSIVVEPKTLVFSRKDQTIMFKLVFTADFNHLSTDYIFGSLVWSDAKHVVRSPIMVKAKNK